MRSSRFTTPLGGIGERGAVMMMPSGSLRKWLLPRLQREGQGAQFLSVLVLQSRGFPVAQHGSHYGDDRKGNPQQAPS